VIANSLTGELRREWRLAASDPVLPVTLAIVAGLTVLAFLAGVQRTNQRREHLQTLLHENAQQREFLESAFLEDPSATEDAKQTVAEQERRRQLQRSARSPDLLRYTAGLWRSRWNMSALAGFSVGASGDWPDSYYHAGTSTARTLQPMRHPNPLLAVLGPFDLTLLVGALLPLAVIVLTYDTATGDQESGRRELIEVHARSWPRLVTVRCLVRVAALGMTVFAVTLACVLIHPAAAWDAAAGLNLVVWIAGVGACLGFWTALTRLIGALSLSSAGAGLTLVLCWGLLVLAIPTGVEIWINRACPIPLQTNLLDIETQALRDAERSADTVWRDFLSHHPELRPQEDSPQQSQLLRDIALQRFVRQRVRAGCADWLQKLLDRESMLDLMQLASPALAWRTVADSCAGTSLRQFVEFTRRTLDFHEESAAYFESMSLAGRELTRADIQSLPTFRAQGLETTLNPRSLVLSFLAVLAWSMTCCLLGEWSFRRAAVQT